MMIRSIGPALRSVVAVSVPIVAAACGGGGSAYGAAPAASAPTPAAAPAVRAPVPPISPDTSPSWFAHDSSWTVDGKMLRRVVNVAFRESAAVADRQSVIDAIGGEVVGGSRIAGRDGVYYVLIAAPGGAEAVQQTVQRLTAMPQVLFASAHTKRPGS
jgi:hypothetical protein